MMKGMVLDDNMSNLTSASNEASISSSNINEIGTTNPNQPPSSKKKRNLPGNPDPDAEVVALSPTTLMATNRFMCEICNKGFKRDQNLQLHRRGHNLPWKLKQRANKDVIKKKVYVCPEPTCIHNDPSRALGDLTGIKKHFSRKHGEKKWKCEKCSKRYAVQSDWKAHSKICGTREYRCDCGTLFSRRDSFITHRAFCDALTEESTKAITTNPLFSTQLHNGLQAFQLKREQLDQHHIFNPNPNPNPNFPPWLAFQGPPPPQPPMELSSQLFSPRLDQSFMHPQNPNPNPSPSPHMSATSLLQKASQMGVTMSTKPSSSEAMCGPHQAHMTTATTNIAGSDLGLSSHEERESGFVHGLSSFGSKAGLTSGFMEQQYDHMMSYSLSSTNGFGGSSSPFEEAFNGMLNQDMGSNNLNRGNEGGGTGGGGLTRDFLGLGPFPNRRFSNMGGLDQISSSSSYDQMNQSQPSWQG